MALSLKNKDSENTTPSSQLGTNIPDRVSSEDQASVSLPTCFQCGQEISGPHFAMGSEKVCTECKVTIEQAFLQGSKSKRFIKASILGALAALIGATVYFLVTWKTGYQYAIIAIGIGWLVGAAVRHGSERRGGWPYQTLAVLLTYLALALPNVPLLVMTSQEDGYLDEPNATAYSAEDAFPEEETIEPGRGEETFTVVASDANTADVTAADATEPFEAGAGTVALGLVMLIGFALISPFFMGFLGILIVLFGLFQAWTMNKGVKLIFEPIDSSK